jgi:hypothetical protein
MFTGGWDQQVMYSWMTGPYISTKRWVLPALYYSAKVWYKDFAVDYYFIDSNHWSALSPEDQPWDNMCSEAHNPPSPLDNCRIAGLSSTAHCKQWFSELWDANIAWLADSASKSQAQWQIVVTHYPPSYGEGRWQPGWKTLSQELGLDLILSGHDHHQKVHYSLYPTTYIVSGGGGGHTSEGTPREDGSDDEYGYVDLTLTREEIMIEMMSHKNIVRKKTCVTPRERGAENQNSLSSPSLCLATPTYAPAAAPAYAPAYAVGNVM